MLITELIIYNNIIIDICLREGMISFEKGHGLEDIIFSEDVI